MKTVKNYNIMLVEDEPLLSQSLAKHIENLDDSFHVVCQATDGRSALEALKDNDVQLVFTDIRMPVMDGLTLTKKMQEKYPQIITIILSGFADFHYAQDALRSGVFDYLLKPINDEALENVLGKVRRELQKQYTLESDITASGKNSQEIVDFVVSYIQEHYMEDIDFSAISSQLGFSSAYLTKLFNKHAGDTPLKRLTEIRISEAKRLLSETSLPIREVGEKVGYPDQFHFSKTFRKITGVNPTAYRKETASSDS